MKRRVSHVEIDSRLVDPSFWPVAIELAAPESGPTVVVTANVHGDECNGIRAVQRLEQKLRAALTRGRVVLYPSLNAAGFAARTRFFPVDGSDLNRAFPGDEHGTPAERYADALWTSILAQGPDLVIDLHSDAAGAVPYVLVDRVLSPRVTPNLAEIMDRVAQSTGLTVVRDYPSDAYQRYGLERSLSGALVNRAGIPALTLELGPRRGIEESAVEGMVHAVIGVLADRRLLGGAPIRSAAIAGKWCRSPGFRAPCDGVLRIRLPAGAQFVAGEILAWIESVGGEGLATVAAPCDGLVLAWTEFAAVSAGNTLGTFAVVDEEGTR